MIRFIFFLASFISFCSTPESAKEVSPFDIAEITLKKDLYLKLMESHQDEFGWIEAKTCDALLFSSLAYSSGLKMDLKQAKDSSGRWYRTPLKNCYEEGRSGSTISRDMLAGLFWALYSTGDRDELLRIYHYGKARSWKMGDGNPDRVFLTPNFVKTLYKTLGKSYKGIPEIWVDPLKDHQRHVVALNILLRGESSGSIPSKALDLVKKFARDEPKNALFQYLKARYETGDFNPVVSILLDENIFPPRSLPVSCKRWLWEKRQSSWYDCEVKTEHSGGDFTFIAELLLRLI